MLCEEQVVLGYDWILIKRFQVWSLVRTRYRISVDRLKPLAKVRLWECEEQQTATPSFCSSEPVLNCRSPPDHQSPDHSLTQCNYHVDSHISEIWLCPHAGWEGSEMLKWTLLRTLASTNHNLICIGVDNHVRNRH